MRARFLQAIVLVALICFGSSYVHSQEEEKATEFTEIKGKVVDSRGKPIEKFNVKIRIYDYADGWQAQPKIVKTWDDEFENGEFQFEVNEPLTTNDKIYIYRTVTADGYLETNQNAGYVQLSTFKGDFKKVKLTRGIKITGKVTLPDDQSEEELGTPKVILSKKMSGFNPDFNNMFQRSCEVKADGTFEATVPEDCKLFVTASCDNAATANQQFKVKKSEAPKDEQDLGEIKLKKGVAIAGTVVNRDGDPVEGQVVQLEQRIGENNYTQSLVYGYAVSDSEGKFKLPPRIGKCSISLVKQANSAGKQIKVKGKLMMAKTVVKTLKVGQPVDDIEIRESRTWKIHGVVTYDPETKLTPLIRSSSANGQQYEVKLDADGKFELEVVDESTPWLSIYGFKNSTVYLAQMSSSSAKQFRDRFTSSVDSENSWFQLEKVTSDIGPLEFRLLKQLVDDRTWSERLFDWYYFGE